MIFSVSFQIAIASVLTLYICQIIFCLPSQLPNLIAAKFSSYTVQVAVLTDLLLQEAVLVTCKQVVHMQFSIMKIFQPTIKTDYIYSMFHDEPYSRAR